ncbi:hypothetical protein E4U57_004400 [Claviceps arundinis]|uniref:Uncharacterized protein n=1 Tax=Claviceps arundinis TaxID=1623583 RepID=A0ABQ7PIV7_9HYPO|nr:hypothetical protein E4U57_004400 [Claviceps arundinis]
MPMPMDCRFRLRCEITRRFKMLGPPAASRGLEAGIGICMAIDNDHQLAASHRAKKRRVAFSAAVV